MKAVMISMPTRELMCFLPLPGAGVTRARRGAGALAFRIVISLGFRRSRRREITVMKISDKEPRSRA